MLTVTDALGVCAPNEVLVGSVTLRGLLSELTSRRADAGLQERVCLGVCVNGEHMPAWSVLTALPLPCARCRQCSNTLHSGAYRPTREPGVFVCSSHHPEAVAASPTLQGPAPRQPGAMPSDSKPPRAPWKAQEANGLRDAGPKARTATREPVVGNSTAKGVPAPADSPVTAASHVHAGSPAGSRFLAGLQGGKASVRVANSSPAGWSSLAQDTAAASPRPAVTPSAPDSRLATPQSRVTPQAAAPQTKVCVGPASPGPADTPGGTPSASKIQQARERFFQTPGAAPSPGPAGTAPAPANAPSGDSSREQALSCLRKALPRLGDTGAQAPGRWVGVGVGGGQGWGQLKRLPGPACLAVLPSLGMRRDPEGLVVGRRRRRCHLELWWTHSRGHGCCPLGPLCGTHGRYTFYRLGTRGRESSRVLPFDPGAAHPLSMW